MEGCLGRFKFCSHQVGGIQHLPKGCLFLDKVGIRFGDTMVFFLRLPGGKRRFFCKSTHGWHGLSWGFVVRKFLLMVFLNLKFPSRSFQWEHIMWHRNRKQAFFGTTWFRSSRKTEKKLIFQGVYETTLINVCCTCSMFLGTGS